MVFTWSQPPFEPDYWNTDLTKNDKWKFKLQYSRKIKWPGTIYIQEVHANNYVFEVVGRFGQLDVWEASVSSVSNGREGNATNTTCFFYPVVLSKYWDESNVFSVNSSIKQQNRDESLLLRVDFASLHEILFSTTDFLFTIQLLCTVINHENLSEHTTDPILVFCQPDRGNPKRKEKERRKKLKKLTKLQNFSSVRYTVKGRNKLPFYIVTFKLWSVSTGKYVRINWSFRTNSKEFYWIFVSLLCSSK